MSTLQDMQNSTMQASARSSASGDRPAVPQRRIERNKSGPQGSRQGPSRRAPGRSKSHKIGRPAFSKDLPSEPTRGVNRNRSGRLRSAPNRTRSFGRKAPDRTGSTGSLRAHRKKQHVPDGPVGPDAGDDVSVSDSVFTSASNQTLDSIMLRKKQFGPGEGKPGRPVRSDNSTDTFEFDESLHTVDSINVHHRHVQAHANDDQGEFSVFSESFASTDTYELSEYEDEDGADVKEVEFENDFEEFVHEEVSSEVQGDGQPMQE